MMKMIYNRFFGLESSSTILKQFDDIVKRISELEDDSSIKKMDRFHQFNQIRSVHNSNNEICSICLDVINDEVKDIPCNHKFHISCLGKCFIEYSTLCPLCRVEIS